MSILSRQLKLATQQMQMVLTPCLRMGLLNLQFRLWVPEAAAAKDREIIFAR
jgi:hypothetical protein